MIETILENIKNDLKILNKFIYDNPELGNKEVQSSKAIMDLLRKHNFEVNEAYLGIQTAFKAVYDSQKSGVHIGLMCEYDALPEIGHGCGHNMIGTLGAGTGIVLKALADQYGGKITVLGTPAEETNGAKVDMANADTFDDIDVAMIAHPSSVNVVEIKSLAMEAIEFVFQGRTAHAASCPERGINALDAVISTFNSINALREHVKSSTRIHGIITEGGLAANIVPERAVAQFYVRSPKKAYLQEVVEKVKNCARGAALSTGAQLEISNYEKSYDDFVNNPSFNHLITEHMVLNGFGPIQASEGMGSIDAGNVSHVCPTIHPLFKICDSDIIGHSRAFADVSITDPALESMYRIILALAGAGLDLMKDEILLKLIKSDHQKYQ